MTRVKLEALLPKMAILTSKSLALYALDSFDPKMTHGSNPTPFVGKEGFFIDEGRVCF